MLHRVQTKWWNSWQNTKKKKKNLTKCSPWCVFSNAWIHILLHPLKHLNQVSNWCLKRCKGFYFTLVALEPFSSRSLNDSTRFIWFCEVTSCFFIKLNQSHETAAEAVTRSFIVFNRWISSQTATTLVRNVSDHICIHLNTKLALILHLKI